MATQISISLPSALDFKGSPLIGTEPENTAPSCLGGEKKQNKKKTEEEREEMEKVAVGQHTAREISMDAAVAVLLSAVNGWHFRI